MFLTRVPMILQLDKFGKYSLNIQWYWKIRNIFTPWNETRNVVLLTITLLKFLITNVLAIYLQSCLCYISNLPLLLHLTSEAHHWSCFLSAALWKPLSMSWDEIPCQKHNGVPNFPRGPSAWLSASNQSAWIFLKINLDPHPPKVTTIKPLRKLRGLHSFYDRAR